MGPMVSGVGRQAGAGEEGCPTLLGTKSRREAMNSC